MGCETNDSIMVDARIGVDDCEIADSRVRVDHGSGQYGDAGPDPNGLRDEGRRPNDGRKLEAERNQLAAYALPEPVGAQRAKGVSHSLAPQTWQHVIAPEDPNASAISWCRVGVCAADNVPTRDPKTIDDDLGVAAGSHDYNR